MRAFITSADMGYEAGRDRPLTQTPGGRLRVDAAGGSDAAPSVVRPAQGTPTQATITLAAATAQTILAAGAVSRSPARVLNYTASPVYIQYGDSGTPASGAPSDLIPAAAGGVPGQWESLYVPTGGLRVVGASAGSLTIQTAG